MAAVSQSTTTLIGGISQQPDPQKIPGQVRDAVNVQLNPTFGCEKRPASKFISELAADIPTGVDDVKWFTIFRDSKEKYVACIYRADTTVIRVWDAATGVERTVTINPDSLEYLDNTSPTSYSHIAINDFTLLANPDKQPTMSAANDQERDDECLIVVNQIAYNTTYTINFLKDGDEVEPVKIYSASSLSVTPSTFEVLDDGGACSLAASQIFTKDSGEKNGLSFELITNCQPTQVPVETARDPYPTSVGEAESKNGSFNTWARSYLGKGENFGEGSYAYVNQQATDPNDSNRYMTVTVECRVSDEEWTFSQINIISYNQDTTWSVGNKLLIFNADRDRGAR